MTDPRQPEPRKKLRLTIEVPGVWADDLEQWAALRADDGEPRDSDRLDVVVYDWLTEEGLLTLMPNDDESGPFLAVFHVRIVGAEAIA